ncbi:MAG: YbaK/EbsC family protein [Nitriliruptorales bacterium]|nr:YbaK/EbsC family protein [Nitriliruptorales bacterium]
MVHTNALSAIEDTDLDYEVVEIGDVSSVEEAADAVGIPLPRFLKTMVVRRDDDDHVFVLVPGNRTIDWPKLREHLGVNRLSLPEAAEALHVTGYERGTITPFGSQRDLPVIADLTVDTPDPVAIGGGAHGVEIVLSGQDLIRHFDADVADVTEVQAD